MTQQPDKPIVAVTGAWGFIGRRLVDELTPDYHVLALDNDPPEDDLPPQYEMPEDAEFMLCDVTRDDHIEVIIGELESRGGRWRDIDSVVHLAAYYNFSGEQSPLYRKVTVEGTRRMLRAFRRLNTSQFVFSSTMLVHKPTEPGRPFNEDQPLEGKWPYPQSKIETERVIREERDGVHAVFLRIAGVYTDECDSIPLSHQIQRIREERLTSHVYPGDTSHGQAFVHIDDTVDAIRLAVERRRELGPEEAFLIGEPETPSYDTLQREFSRLIHGEKEWTTEHIPKPVAQAGAWVQGKIPGMEEPFIKPWMVEIADDHYELDITRARERLGWNPRRRLLDTLPSMIAALKKDPEAWYHRHGLKSHSHSA